MSFEDYQVPYPVSEKYSKKVAYFSMEFAVHQPLKIYSGGLGFLSGSHMRSAYELKQNLIGIGILWKFGYYDQARLRGRDYYDDASERFDEAQRYVTERVQERPVQSTAIALGVGLVLGLLLAGRRR
jgi:glucan phosphorylase